LSQIPVEAYLAGPKVLPVERMFSNHALLFDSTQNQRVLTPTTGFSIAEGTWILWLRGANSIAWRDYLGIFLNAANFIRLELSNVLCVTAYSQSGGIGQNLIPVAGWFNATDGLFHMVVFTFSQANNRKSLYFDGRLAASSVGWTGFAVPAGFNIGCYDGATRFQNCLLDEIQVLDYEATIEEISKILMRGYARRQTGSVLNLRLEEGVGDTVFDTSGQGNDGTLLGITLPVWTRIAKHELLTEAKV